MSLSTIDRDTLAAANINPDTGLATDYLNHFNEVAMLIDMLPSMPDVAEEVLEWRPVSYAEHFVTTGFREKELAIAAFNAAAPTVREDFTSACTLVEAMILGVQETIKNDPNALSDPSASAAEIYELISYVGGVINPGGASNADLGPAPDDQAAIDALFD